MLQLFVLFQMLLCCLMGCECVIIRNQPFSTANGFLVFVTQGYLDLATSKGLTFCNDNSVIEEHLFHLRSFQYLQRLGRTWFVLHIVTRTEFLST